MKHKLFAFSLAMAALALTDSAMAEGDAAAGKTKSATCAACHGMDGNSPMNVWPNLAGQDSSYIFKQLQDFKAARRTNEVMSPMGAPLNEPDMKDLAAYFSSQTIKAGGSETNMGGLGEQIYKKGNIKQRIIACVGCHGLNGEGNPKLQAPAVGGQHAEYMVLQLKAFKSGSRSNDTGKMMRNIVASMTEDEIDAVAQYISGLSR